METNSVEKDNNMEKRFQGIDNKNEKEKEILKMGAFSLEFEEKKEQSLILQSGHMLTGVSIVSVILLAMIPIVLANKDLIGVSEKTILLRLGFSLFGLVLSLLFAVIAHLRYKQQGFNSIKSIYVSMMFVPIDEFNQWWLESLHEIYTGKSKWNKRRILSLLISALLFTFSIITILI